MSNRAPSYAPALLFAVALGILAPGGLLAQAGYEPAGGRLPAAEHRALRARADSLRAAGEPAAAIPLYERVVASDPRDGESLWRLARSRFETGDTEAAVRDAEAAFAMGFGDEAGASFEIARALARAGGSEAALPWIERSLAAGMEERPSYRTDAAFAGMRDDPRFRRLAGLPPTGEADRAARWSHDLDFYLEEVRRLHADPGGVARSGWFADSVAAVKARIGALSDVEAFAQVFRLTVLLGDGHSVAIPMPTEAIPVPPAIPPTFWIFSDGVHVLSAPEPDLAGARVTAIEGRPIEEAVAALPSWIPHDNPMGVLWSGPLALRYPFLLQAMGLVDDPDSVRFSLVDRTGAAREVTWTPVPGAPRGSRLVAPPEIEPPAWLARIADNYWFEPRPELDALYLQFNRVRDDPEESIEAFARRARTALEGRRNLIVDVRHNNGGNNFLIWPLVALAMWHEMEDPANRVWVLTSRNTFSAAQNFVNFLDRETNATFVGEPSGSKPNFVGESTEVMLPYSGIRLSISSRYWQDSWPGDDRIWIPVEAPVDLSAADWLAGRDPAMEALAAILGAE